MNAGTTIGTRQLRPLATAVAAAVIGLAAFAVAGPHPQRLRSSSGDPALAELTLRVLGAGGVSSASVALIEDGGARVRFAALAAPGQRVDERTPYETGSIGKVFTGMLLADAVHRREVRLDQPVSGLGVRGGATLQQLATHTSGLPRVDLGTRAILAQWWARVTASNPYHGSAEDVLAAVSRRDPDGGRFEYSNLGMSALGDLLARRAGRPYDRLLTDRLLLPLGMTSTVVVTSPDQLPAGHAVPRDSSGRVQQPWMASGYEPAGVGVWSTTADLTRLVSAVLAGTAPGADATGPLVQAGSGDTRIGLAWLTTRWQGRTITWHNGETAGCSTFVGFDRGSGRGVVVMATTSKNLDDVGLRLVAAR